MLTIEFRSVGPGACGWCRKERSDVFNVAFSDKTFVGPMCKNDLLRAIAMKVGPETEPKKFPASPVASAGPAK